MASTIRPAVRSCATRRASEARTASGSGPSSSTYSQAGPFGSPATESGPLAAATRGQDVDTIVRFDLAFHAAITAFIGNSRIDEFYAGLTRELQFFLKLLSLHDREYEENSNILPEHQRLLDAIVSGDKQRARAEVEHHIAVNHLRVREILTAVYG